MKERKGESVFIATREISGNNTTKGNVRNRLWWEQMPMTYKHWEGENRELDSLEDFKFAEETLFSNSPFLREEYDFSVYAGKKVLDLGCGTGVLSVVLARNGADVTAIDLTENATKMTQRNASLHNLNIRVIRADAERLALANESFDYVLSWGVLHHTENSEQAFSEVSRILKPNGTGLIMVYHKSSVFYYIKGLVWLFLKGKIFKGYNLGTVIDFYVDGYFHRHFTAEELKKSLSQSNLRSENVFSTQQQQKIIPFIPKFMDLLLKYHFGWYLISCFRKL